MDFEFAAALYYNYFNYKEELLTTKRVKHSDICKLINGLDNNIFQISKQGESYCGREINLVNAGTGEKKIFVWSQMHGDESTATMAIFDIFNFLGRRDGFDSVRKKIFDNASLYFLPMVNPDGAEQFRRGNYLDIDINRDAIRMQTPEGKILRETFDIIDADFGFNLHDQNIRYTSGNSHKNAAISFLAPLFDSKGTINTTRGNAIKLISGLTSILNSYIPGHIARYEEDYEPRSFGDTFQGLGTSTILIESGGWKGDREKQFIRKLNFILLLSSINSIIDNDYEKESFDLYNNLPFNKESLYDLILRNLSIKREDKISIIDIGINNKEEIDETTGNTNMISRIEEIGDLSNFYGHEEYNLDGYYIEPNKGRLKIGDKPEIMIKKDEQLKYTFENGDLTHSSLQ
ncbi:MAG: M14 family zinc carboxypeptidase [Ignavibacteriaceae bacterium]|nr:M14 family zinc carboxypeptidase [Ignavibacteriaceae bacterium]